jgi:hypothetical protein
MQQPSASQVQAYNLPLDPITKEVGGITERKSLYQPTRQREHQLRRFKSLGICHAPSYRVFRVRPLRHGER